LLKALLLKALLLKKSPQSSSHHAC